MVTQCDNILAYMKTHDGITPREAEDLFGCMRLASRISDLRRDGIPVRSEMIAVRNKYGQKRRIAFYSLPKEVKDA